MQSPTCENILVSYHHTVSVENLRMSYSQYTFFAALRNCVRSVMEDEIDGKVKWTKNRKAIGPKYVEKASRLNKGAAIAGLAGSESA